MNAMLQQAELLRMTANVGTAERDPGKAIHGMFLALCRWHVEGQITRREFRLANAELHHLYGAAGIGRRGT